MNTKNLALIAMASIAAIQFAHAQYTFGQQVRSTNTVSITYDSGTGVFQYTGASHSTNNTASLPLTGNAASFITSTNGWRASVIVNVSAATITATSDYSPGDGMGLAVVHLNNGNEYYVSILLGQDNNTGGASPYLPDGWYGTGAYLLARLNGTYEDTTPLGASVYDNGVSGLALSGATNAMAATESIGAVSGVVTLDYDASTETVTGYYNGTPVASYSIAGWGSDPKLTLYVFGSSGIGIVVPAGGETASNFYASASPAGTSVGIIRSGANVVLMWPTNATGFTLESTTNLGSSAAWTTNSSAPFVVNDQYAVTNPVSATQQFYRLIQ
jgi:hypothetical protein